MKKFIFVLFISVAGTSLISSAEGVPLSFTRSNFNSSLGVHLGHGWVLTARHAAFRCDENWTRPIELGTQVEISYRWQEPDGSSSPISDGLGRVDRVVGAQSNGRVAQVRGLDCGVSELPLPDLALLHTQEFRPGTRHSAQGKAAIFVGDRLPEEGRFLVESRNPGWINLTHCNSYLCFGVAPTREDIQNGYTTIDYGDSGSGLFYVSSEGEPKLLGITSRVSDRENGRSIYIFTSLLGSGVRRWVEETIQE